MEIYLSQYFDIVKIKRPEVDRRNKKSPREIFPRALSLMVRLAGLEPATYGLEVRCSIQLSYRRKQKVAYSRPNQLRQINFTMFPYFFMHSRLKKNLRPIRPVIPLPCP